MNSKLVSPESSTGSNRANISAVVFTHNEGHLIEDCLRSVSFCAEVIQIDLESTDDSLKRGKKHSTFQMSTRRPNHVEVHYEWAASIASNDWILLIDPDEIITDGLKNAIINILTTGTLDKVAIIRLPWLFFFKGKPLKGGRWGGLRYKKSLVNKRRCKFYDTVHSGIKATPGQHEIKLECSIPNSDVIQHYWMQSYTQLIEKHRRYLRNEGESRFSRGERVSIGKFLTIPLKSFLRVYIKQNGYRDAITGLFLALFWSWYNTESHLKLLCRQNTK